MAKQRPTVDVKSTWFPREQARSLNYTLGAPRTLRVSKDGRRVFFLRSKSATERALDLWLAEISSTDPLKVKESLLVRFADLQHGRGPGGDPNADRARRERLREAASGITTYSIDAMGKVAAFALGGDIYVLRVGGSQRPMFLAAGDATDLKVAPNGERIAFVSGRELLVAKLGRSAIGRPRRISPPASATVSWGLAEFIAAEEMRRHDGYWWSPDSKAIVFAGVDESQVPIWYVSDPANPASSPRPIRYPCAGAANARVSLFLWSWNRAREIRWNKQRFPYVVGVRWRKNEPTVAVQDRLQRQVVLLAVARETGRTSPTYSKSDQRWVDLVPGVPAWGKDECIVDAPDAETRRLYVAGKPVSKRELQVRKFVGEAASGGFIYLASEDAKETHVWISYPDQTHIRLSEGRGVFDAEVGGNTAVVFGPGLGDRPLKAEILALADPSRRVALRSVSAKVAIQPRPQFLQTRVRNINYAILYPKAFRHDRKLPVLMDPYGGPAAQRCVKSSLAFTAGQWFADQGFAVIVADGRGTPGRGRAWEQAIAGDLIGPALADQIAVLDHAIATGAPIDSTRVGIRGWSYGGYLAAMAVLLRPDRFHAAISGAPVTDWRFYDTHYTERYLGDPKRNAKAYDSCSAVLAAPRLARPLLLIHGLSDDNVFAAHTLRLSQALFQAGRQHSVLPLTGITHMAASEVAAEMLLRAQLRFLREALKVG